MKNHGLLLSFLGLCTVLYMWLSRFQEFDEIFQSPLILQFSFKLFTCLLLMTGNTQAAAILKNCHWLFLTNFLGRAVHKERALIQSNKDNFWEWSFSVCCQICQMMTMLSTGVPRKLLRGFWGTPISFASSCGF